MWKNKLNEKTDPSKLNSYQKWPWKRMMWCGKIEFSIDVEYFFFNLPTFYEWNNIFAYSSEMREKKNTDNNIEISAFISF